jgi:hypothetical protein
VHNFVCITPGPTDESTNRLLLIESLFDPALPPSPSAFTLPSVTGGGCESLALVNVLRYAMDMV